MPSIRAGCCTRHVDFVAFLVQRQLDAYLAPDRLGLDRLYVLEFQGPTQFVKFGRTTSLQRRVAKHQRTAASYGWSLLNGWASPGLPNAQQLELSVLDFAETAAVGTRQNSASERFYGMPFEKAVLVARSLFELQAPDEMGAWPTSAAAPAWFDLEAEWGPFDYSP